MNQGNPDLPQPAALQCDFPFVRKMSASDDALSRPLLDEHDTECNAADHLGEAGTAHVVAPDDEQGQSPAEQSLWHCFKRATCQLLFHDTDTLSQYARVALVEALLLAGYGVTRLATLTGLPDDAWTRPADGALVATDFSSLLQLGVLLAWLTGLHTAQRFAWLCNRPLFLAVFLCTCPVYSALNEVPGLQVSLVNVQSWGPVAWVTMLAVAAVVAWIVIWHMHYSSSCIAPRDGIAYVSSRVIVILFSLAQWLLMKASAPGRSHEERFHMHHFYIGFLVAIWGSFNHPLSATLLAIGASIMVQGIAAYHAAALFETTNAGRIAAAHRAGCATLVMNNSSATHATCVFDAEELRLNTTWGVWACPAFYSGKAPLVNCTLDDITR